jgi:hypothetical protein
MLVSVESFGESLEKAFQEFSGISGIAEITVYKNDEGYKALEK